MKKVFNREESPEPEVTLGNSGGFLKHAKSLQNEDVGVVSTAGPIEEKKKRGRPRKKKLDNANDFLEVEKSDRELSMAESNKPYLDTYAETNNMLKGSVNQIDMMQNDLQTDLTTIRASKTLKKKYDYISEISSTASTLISTKVSAIREMNKVMTDCHNLEMKRLKDLRMSAATSQDEDKKIMDMYQAFINTPIGGGGNPLGFSTQDMTLQSGSINMLPVGIGNDIQEPLNPSQNMMRLESNPNVKTVVVYDASTGNRWFDVIDTTTGESIPNVDKPDAMFLENTTIDIRNQIARNTDLDTTYQLVVLNNNSMNEY